MIAPLTDLPSPRPHPRHCWRRTRRIASAAAATTKSICGRGRNSNEIASTGRGGETCTTVVPKVRFQLFQFLPPSRARVSVSARINLERLPRRVPPYLYLMWPQRPFARRSFVKGARRPVFPAVRPPNPSIINHISERVDKTSETSSLFCPSD